MRTEKIYFPHQQALCVFPDERSDLGQAISELGLKGRYPVIVLIGGDIDKQMAGATQRAIQTIAKVAEDMKAVVVCGGTDMGVMAVVGQMRSQNGHKFPLIGVAPEELVTWPGGPRSTKFLWWGKLRWQLEPHYSHFVLVPGSQFGDESAVDSGYSDYLIQRSQVGDDLDQWWRGFPQRYPIEFGEWSSDHCFESYGASGR